MLKISSLAVSCNDKPIIHAVNVQMEPGSIHALIGPNGSGKSTLAHTIIGNPACVVTSGSIFYSNQDITQMSCDARARQGIFLSFQHPPVIPGMTVITFLKEACRAVSGQSVLSSEFETRLYEAFSLVGLDPSFAYRNLNEGFSGGEKKRFELVQCLLLKPSFVILDEIDSGLDVDALRAVAKVLHSMRKENPSIIICIITHYRRILDYIRPDFIHILYQGTIVDSGDYQLMAVIEEKGYDGYRSAL